MVRALAIDPGNRVTAIVFLYDDGVVEGQFLWNEQVREQVSLIDSCSNAVVICEMVESYGMPVGAEIFETVYWIGRYSEVAAANDLRFERISRREVKLHLCGNARAKDSNVRAALLDLFGGSNAKGTKKAPGPLYHFRRDLFAALGVLVTWCDANNVPIGKRTEPLWAVRA